MSRWMERSIVPSSREQREPTSKRTSAQCVHCWTQRHVNACEGHLLSCGLPSVSGGDDDDDDDGDE